MSRPRFLAKSPKRGSRGRKTTPPPLEKKGDPEEVRNPDYDELQKADLADLKKVDLREGKKENDSKQVSIIKDHTLRRQIGEKWPSEAAQVLMRRFAKNCALKGVENILVEFIELSSNCPKPKDLNHDACKKWPKKNRYKDVICIEDSRVHLLYPPGNDCDYIHASYIQNFRELDRTIICTQGPMPELQRVYACIVQHDVHGCRRFWRMVWQEKAQGIVMLCNVMENGKKKCELYWPEKQGETMTLKTGITVKNNGVAEVPSNMWHTRLQLQAKGSDGTVKTHHCSHVRWLGWPDKDVPLSTKGALRCINYTQGYSTSIIHCSAGVGRTGTMVAIEHALRILNAEQDLTIYNVVRDLRRKRYLACQTAHQYLYVHRAVLAYIMAKKILNEEHAEYKEVMTWIDAYDAEVKPKKKEDATVDSKR